jgi:hypothetical protein
MAIMAALRYANGRKVPATRSTEKSHLLSPAQATARGSGISPTLQTIPAYSPG